MRIENNFKINNNYLTVEDVQIGECFRYIGDETIYFKTCNGCYNLDDGDDNFAVNDEAFVVEKVIGRFVVDEIISNIDKGKHDSTGII